MADAHRLQHELLYGQIYAILTQQCISTDSSESLEDLSHDVHYISRLEISCQGHKVIQCMITW